MRISFFFIPIEFEITARRRTEPFRLSIRAAMIATAIAALAVYLFMPRSAEDRRLMAAYERLGSTGPKIHVTKAQVIRDIGPPSSSDVPRPKTSPVHRWVADFETPLGYQQYNLILSFNGNGDDDELNGWGLSKTEYHGAELLWVKLTRFFSTIGF